MATKLIPGATGQAWQSRLLHVQYKGETICARHEYFSSLDQIVDDPFGFYSITCNSPLQSKIVKASAFIIDLPVKKWLPKEADKALTHHIVEMEAESGDHFTLEKGRDCILLQSCRRENPNKKPIIRQQRDGKKRAKLPSLERVITEHDPKPTTVFDLLKWLNDGGRDGQQGSRLMEPYHVLNSNCQHFAAHLWHELSSEEYPNPSRYTSEGGYASRQEMNEEYYSYPHFNLEEEPSTAPSQDFSDEDRLHLRPSKPTQAAAEGEAPEAYETNQVLGYDMVPSEKKGTIMDRYIISSPVVTVEQEAVSHLQQEFPGGEGFVAEVLDGRIIVWGGMQRQVDGSNIPLPQDVIFSYNLDHRSFREGTATGRWEASGEIPDGFYDAASVVCNQNIFISGGCQSLGPRQLTNSLTTLSSSGHFQRLRPIGDILSPRAYHRGFSYNGEIYFFGGVVKTTDPLREEDFISGASGGFYTNELIGLHPSSFLFSRVSTNGARPTPRADCALGMLKEMVFIHGGHRSRHILNDFYVLNMVTKIWTEIHNTGFSRGIACHTLTRLPLNRILLVGGKQHDENARRKRRNSKAVKIFDTEKLEWKEEAPLPPEVDGSGGGFNAHRAVGMQTENGSVLICLGGFADATLSEHPSQMILFRVHK